MTEDTSLPTPPAGYAVVFGTGGRAGWVWHVGIGRALQRAGLAVPGADLVIGTSAGAAIGSLLTAGLAPDAILDRLSRRPSSAQRRTALTDAQARIGLSAMLPSSPRLVIEAMRRRTGPMTAFVGMIPSGWVPTWLMTQHLGLDTITTWPSNLRITAVSLEDGKVRVFGPTSDGVSVSDAVEASSAVPLMFSPKIIGGVRFVDGGLASATHARLALHVQSPHVIVSAPAARSGRSIGLRRIRKGLDADLAMLDAAGRRVTLIAPSPTLATLWQRVARRDFSAGQELVDRAEEVATAELTGAQGEGGRTVRRTTIDG